MRSVQKAEFDKFIADFTDDGRHEVQKMPPITSLDRGSSVVQYLNPDIGLIGEAYTEGDKVTYLIVETPGLKVNNERPLGELYQLWDRLRNVPVNEKGFSEEAFEHFPSGTHYEQIYRWFEAQNPRFIVGEAMQGIRHSEETGKRFETHVYATVRVKVIGTNFSADPDEVAEKVADAVCADSSQWMRPVHGSVTVDGHGQFDIDAVEFADGIYGVLVDELDPNTGRVVKEHNYDEACSRRVDEVAGNRAIVDGVTDQGENVATLERINGARTRVLVLHAAKSETTFVIPPGCAELDTLRSEANAAELKAKELMAQAAVLKARADLARIGARLVEEEARRIPSSGASRARKPRSSPSLGM